MLLDLKEDQVELVCTSDVIALSGWFSVSIDHSTFLNSPLYPQPSLRTICIITCMLDM